MCIASQVSAITTSAQNDRRAYRDDIARLRQETDEAFGLLQTETDVAYGPSVRGIPGLIALSRKNAEDIQELLAFAEAHKNDVNVLRKDVGLCLELRTTVDGLKSTVNDMNTCQLTHIRESIKRVETTASTKLDTMDKTFTEALDTVHVR